MPLAAGRRGWSIHHRLLMLVAALIVPMMLLVVASIAMLAMEQRRAQYRNLQFTARTLVSAIDAKVASYIALGNALASSPALLDDDLSRFRMEAARAFPEPTRVSLIVHDPAGQQLLNLLRPPGAPLPVRMPDGVKAQQEAFDTRAMQISGAIQGALTRRWAVGIDFPIFRDGAPFRAMTVVVNTAVFRDLLASQNQPSTWLTGIADRQGRFIARLPDHDASVGRPASAGWRAVMDRNGIGHFPALDGEMVANANEISTLSGWRVAIAVKESELARPVWSAIAFSVAASIVVSALSLLVAMRLSRSIAGPVAELERKAVALVGGESPEPPEHSLPEVTRVWNALQGAVAERTEAERQRGLLTDELSHRVKNTLAVVQAMAIQTLRAEPDPQAFKEAFSARIASLARAHDLLTRGAWSSAGLRELIGAAVAPFRSGGREIVIDGPSVDVPASAVVTLSLMLHELASNAAKHGALSTPEGRIDIVWTARDSHVVDLLWTESGGPAVSPPTRTGFGTRLLQMGAGQLRGHIRKDFAPAGLACALSFTVSKTAA